MKWIVMGESDGGKIKLVSQNSNNSGILPKGSYLTIESGDVLHVLRVDESYQDEPYHPSTLISDLNLDGLSSDNNCKNIVLAYRVYDKTNRNDGLIDFIKPQQYARRSTQAEIDLALGDIEKGPRVFVAAMQANQDTILADDEGKLITAKLPEEMFFHQMMICGKTGSGKTVSIKYLTQYFIEEMQGAVLAVNVKDVDLLMMDKATDVTNDEISREWKDVEGYAHGISNFTIYKPANDDRRQVGIDSNRCRKIGLDVAKIDPESLAGLLQGISEIGAMSLPSIFAYWRKTKQDKNLPVRFTDFCKEFSANEGRSFNAINSRGESIPVTLHKATFDNIIRCLSNASSFFDNNGLQVLDADDILTPGNLSVIDVTGKDGTSFGSVLLRDLLSKIVAVKQNRTNDVPVLIIIDEVHMFYNTSASMEALGDLDTICRTGRSSKIGVIFASQSPADIPSGLSSVIDTKIFFKTDSPNVKPLGIKVTPEELEGLKAGFAVASIHSLPQLKVLKFPLAFAGVVRNG
ncbi:MAG: ATP-binding protein [Candidatus Methanomethylophilus sp.]|nr:ATP-binding protein [Methanomethylophilus sp.]MDD4668551.1 ATP-binding protein [Methanomethylophilus sp.]